jgi:hypothetical protein
VLAAFAAARTAARWRRAPPVAQVLVPVANVLDPIAPIFAPIAPIAPIAPVFTPVAPILAAVAPIFTAVRARTRRRPWRAARGGDLIRPRFMQPGQAFTDLFAGQALLLPVLDLLEEVLV